MILTMLSLSSGKAGVKETADEAGEVNYRPKCLLISLLHVYTLYLGPKSSFREVVELKLYMLLSDCKDEFDLFSGLQGSRGQQSRKDDLRQEHR